MVKRNLLKMQLRLVLMESLFLIFRLNRPDVFPVGDLGIVKGMQKLHGMKRRPAPSTMERLAEPWRPYRSIAAWYLWRIVD